jgi:hypothetical protein
MMAFTSQVPEHVPGGPVPLRERALETGAGLMQSFDPVKQICAHLNAFHTYADEPGRFVETNHYCSHLTSGMYRRSLNRGRDCLAAYAITDVRQCILYDGPGPDAKLIGIEYMVTPKIYASLPDEERKLWHSHVYEVKSGMLIMPGPGGPGLQQAWEAAEVEEMKEVVHLYGKVYHLWQTDRGDELPLGEPRLMTSFTADGQFDFEKAVGERDARFATDWRQKRAMREGIETPSVHADADQAWKRRNSM